MCKGWLLLALLTLCACSSEAPNYPARQIPVGLFEDQQAIASGKTLFLEKCAVCHGHASEGRSPRASFFEPPAPDFTEPSYRSVDPAYLFWRIEVGKTVEPYLSKGSVMPSWRALEDDQIWQLVAYLHQRSS